MTTEQTKPTICLNCGEPIPCEQYPEHARTCDSTVIEDRIAERLVLPEENNDG